MTYEDNGGSGPGARDEYRYAKLVLAWHGWGAPVGLGLFLLAVGLAAVLFRHAFLGI
jgi:hypothetical protein